MLDETKINANMQIFKERLKSLRGKKSLQEVAQDLGISRATLGYYECGERKPDIEILLKIATYYDVSCDYLLGLTDCYSSKIENRAISEKTGLTQDAIENLHYYNTATDKELKECFIPTINLLLSSSCRLIYQIAGYLNFNFDFASEVPYKESDHDYKLSQNTISLDSFAVFDTNYSMMLRVDSELINNALLVNIQNELVQMRNQILENKLTNRDSDKE